MRRLDKQVSNTSVGIASDWDSESFEDHAENAQRSVCPQGLPSAMWQNETAVRRPSTGAERSSPLMMRPPLERSTSSSRTNVSFTSQSPHSARSPHLPPSLQQAHQMQGFQEHNHYHLQQHQLQYQQQMSYNQPLSYQSEVFQHHQQEFPPSPHMNSTQFSPQQQFQCQQPQQTMPAYREQNRPQHRLRGRTFLQKSNSGEHQIASFPPSPPSQGSGFSPHAAPFMSSPRIDHGQYSSHQQELSLSSQYTGPGNLHRSRTPSPLLHGVPPPPMGSHARTTSPSPKLAITVPPEVVFQVQFKRGFNDFILSPHVVEAVRIWMKKTNQGTPFFPKRFATLSLSTGVQFA
eukprot:gene28114-34920_t